jgi:hypothetical protein
LYTHADGVGTDPVVQLKQLYWQNRIIGFEAVKIKKINAKRSAPTAIL